MSSRKKVLLISCVFPPEPIVSAQISKDLALSLNDKGASVFILVPAPSRPAGFDFGTFDIDSSFYKRLLPEAEVITLQSYTSPKGSFIGRFIENYTFGMHCVKYIKANSARFDIVYMNSWPVISQYLVAKACKNLDIPYVTHVQDIYPESLVVKLPFLVGRCLNLLMLPFDKFHLKNAKRVIAISDNMKNYLRTSRQIDNDNFSVVHNWQNEQSFIHKSDYLGDKPKFTFMYLGNIGAVAGVELLIKAFHKSNLEDCNLIIAGSGTNKSKCIHLASRLNATNVFFKEVPGGEVATVQQEADVFLLPLNKGAAASSIPSKLPAYMFSSRPIIASLDADSDTARAILAAECGWVGPPEDEDWLANQMRFVYSLSREKLCSMGRNGLQYSLRHYSKRVNLEKLVKKILND